jgi:ATP-dependent Lon protease
LDADGNVYAISKWTGLKAKDVKAKLGSPEILPSVDETRSTIHSKVTDQMRGYIRDIKDRQNCEVDPLRDQLRDMKNAHREERQKLKAGQEERWTEETKLRSDRLNKGLRGLFDRLTGKAKSIRQQNELDARKAAKRDQKQRDFMVVEQMKERRALHREFLRLRRKHQKERTLIAQKIRTSIQTLQKSSPSRSRDRGPDFSL